MNFTITVLGQLIFFILTLHRAGLINFLIISLPFHIFGAIMLILLQSLQKCSCCTSSCCESITQRTLLNVDNPLEQIEFRQTANEEHEMQIQI